METERLLVCQRCGSEFLSKRASGVWVNTPKCCAKCRGRASWEARRKKGKCRSEDKYVSKIGYVMVKLDAKNEYGSSNYHAEHRLVMAQMLGRPLKNGESVHHKDGNRANNQPGNLELWLRPSVSGFRACDLICPHCGKPYYPSII